MSQSRTIQIESNKAFAWPKGQRLVAGEQVTILLPGGLVQGSEEIVKRGNGQNGCKAGLDWVW